MLVDRKDLQELSKVRLKEATALLKLGLFDGAYYLAGYAVECALKACVLSRMGETGWIFSEPKVKIEETITTEYCHGSGITGR